MRALSSGYRMAKGNLWAICLFQILVLAVTLPFALKDLADSGPVADGFHLIKIKNSAKGAVCLDGTPPGYYIREADPQKWIVHLEGGGWCIDEADCVARSKTDLGSSKAWKPIGIPPMDGGVHGMFNPDPTLNTEFFNYTKIFVMYCDGASFAGNTSAPVVVNGTKLYFRGLAVLEEVFSSLLAAGLGKADELLVKGGSAGGLAVYLHLDYIRTLIPATVQIKGLADGGFFLDSPTKESTPLWTPRFMQISKMQNAVSDADCTAYFEDDKAWMCFMAPYVSVFIQTPIYLLNSFYDTWQLYNILNLTCTNGWTDVSKCNSTEIDVIEKQRGAMIMNIKAILQMRGGMNGGFLWACPIHTITGNDLAWFEGDAVGTGMREAFSSWYFETKKLPEWTIDCAYPCNTKCPNM